MLVDGKIFTQGLGGNSLLFFDQVPLNAPQLKNSPLGVLHHCIPSHTFFMCLQLPNEQSKG